MYIVVTGAAGFIGSNIVKALTSAASPTSSRSTTSAAPNSITSPIARSPTTRQDHFRAALDAGGSSMATSLRSCIKAPARHDAHRRAPLMETTTAISVDLVAYAVRSVPLIPACAAVYGAGPVSKEDRDNERPLNVWVFRIPVRPGGAGAGMKTPPRWPDCYWRLRSLEPYKERMASWRSIATTSIMKPARSAVRRQQLRRRRYSGAISFPSRTRESQPVLLDNPKKAGIFNLQDRRLANLQRRRRRDWECAARGSERESAF